MSEPEKPLAEKPLTDYALQRLRALAEGNGLDPLKIKINSSDEKDVTLTGLINLTAKAEVRTQQLLGRNLKLPKVEKSFTSFNELAEFVGERQKELQSSADWYDEVMADLDKQPGKGWGLENARIVFDNRPDENYSASVGCTKCFGKGTLTCEYCAGRAYTPCRVCSERGTEPCYTCYGNGLNPQDQNLPCPTCNGSRFAICRTCQGRKGIPCGNCQASGVVMCPPCKGGGKIVELSTINFGAEAVFASGSGAELPSALRRAMDRTGGVKSLANGHAQIEYAKPTDEDKRPGVMQVKYTAKLRTADIVVQLGERGSRIAVFGNKRTMLEVPAFLDQSLEEPLQQLAAVAKGKGALDKMLEYRAFKDACGLILTGQGKPENLRKLYPLGMSKDMMQKILQTMRKALARQTMAARWIGFLASFVLADVLGGAFYLTPLHKTLLLSGGKNAALGGEIFVPLFCAFLGFVLTGQAALFHLQRRFPEKKLGLHHHGGILALCAAGIGLLVPFLISWLQPDGVVWLTYLRR